MTSPNTAGGSQFLEAAEAAHNNFETRSRAIKDNTDLSAHGKARALSELRDQTLARLAEAKSGHKASIAKRTKELHRYLFDRSSTEGNDPALTVSYRDAAERVSRLSDQTPRRSHTEALELMNWALQNQDAPLERALLRVAFENRWDQVVNAFVDAKPRTKQEAAEELWRLTDPGRMDFTTLVFHPTREMTTPTETFMTPAHTARLANSQNKWLPSRQ